MSDLEKRARQAARQEREEWARHSAETERKRRLDEESDGAAKAELADAALEQVLGVRIGPSQWRRTDLSHQSPHYEHHASGNADDYGVVAEVEGIRVYWHCGKLYPARPDGSPDYSPNEPLTLARFGHMLAVRAAERAREEAISRAKRPWYKKIR